MQVAYAIGVAHPVSVMVETFGTEKIGRGRIAQLVDEHFDLRPGAFREELKLHRPIYQKTAAYGHFGRDDADFTWESTDKADALREAAGLAEAVTAMSLTVVGSIAYDTVRTPFGERERMLGGAATHFALAASFFDQVRPVGPVGDDFGDEDLAVLATRGTDVDDVERVAGRQDVLLGGRVRLGPELARDASTRSSTCSSTFQPKLSAAARACDVLFLANIQPQLQLDVLEACDGPRFTAMDSMNLWIDIARDDAREGHRARGLRDPQRRRAAPAHGEAEPRLGGARGPDVGPVGRRRQAGRVRRGAHHGRRVLRAAGLSAGDGRRPDRARATRSPAGSSAGSPRTPTGSPSDDALRQAMAYGTAIASYNVEEFGTERVARLTIDEVHERVADIQALTQFSSEALQYV